MHRLLLILLIFCSAKTMAQPDSTKWLRAFPITDYMVELNDSVRVVQVELPDGLVIKDRSLGMVYGTYSSSAEDVVQKGYGRCHLIKSNFFYFSIGNNKSGKELKEGDLVYTFMDKTSVHYEQIVPLAAHFIQLLNVHELPFYDRYFVFNKWDKKDEQTLIDTMVADIQFTGQYMLQNDPSLDKLITSGKYKDQKILYVMAECQPDDLRAFLDYMIARPRNYAGKKWKISELFATWLSNGAPLVVK